jgi:hypothetical protein
MAHRTKHDITARAAKGSPSGDSKPLVDVFALSRSPQLSQCRAHSAKLTVAQVRNICDCSGDQAVQVRAIATPLDNNVQDEHQEGRH